MHDTTSSRLTINNLWRQGSSDNLRSGSTSIFRRLIAASDQRRASLVHFFPFHSSKRSSSWASIPRSLFLSSSSIFFRSTAKEAIRFFRILDSPIESRIESTETDEGNSCEWKRKGKLVRGFRGLRTISTINIYILYIHDDCTLLRNPARVIHNCFNTYLRSFAFHRNLLFSAQYYIRIFASRPSTAVHRLCARRRNYIDNVVPFPHLPTY